jgi:hypothetical protein
MEKPTSEERALDALLVGALRQIDAEPTVLDARDVPELSEDEKAAMDALGDEFVKRLLAAERPPTSVPIQPMTIRERSWLPLVGVCGALAAAFLFAVLALSGRNHRNPDSPPSRQFTEQKASQVVDELASLDVEPKARRVFHGPELTTFSWPLEARTPLIAFSSVLSNLPN